MDNKHKNDCEGLHRDCEGLHRSYYILLVEDLYNYYCALICLPSKGEFHVFPKMSVKSFVFLSYRHSRVWMKMEKNEQKKEPPARNVWILALMLLVPVY